jgi:hypothetical protein
LTSISAVSTPTPDLVIVLAVREDCHFDPPCQEIGHPALGIGVAGWVLDFRTRTEVEFAKDSSLEEDGFELAVPPRTE